MKDTKAVLTEAYPNIEKNMKTHTKNYMNCVSRFINARSTSLYSNVPCDKLYFSQEDENDFYKSIDISEKDMQTAISHTYYYPISDFNPRYAKDDFVVSMMCVIRYFKLKNMKKELDLAMTHLAFSGKFYTSIFHGSFPTADPKPYIMEYVITHMCSNKFDIIREGNLIGAIRSICETWMNTYTSRFKDFHDDDIVYLVQQLHSRIRSFFNNIADLYYDAHESKDSYVVYDSDDVSEDNYHIADSDSLVIERAVNATLTNINSHGIDYRICKLASNDLIKTDELKNIIEVLLSDHNNMPYIRSLITNIVATFYFYNKGADIRDLSFVAFTIKAKPNSKDKLVLEQRDILNKILLSSSSNFARRRNRAATESAYYRAILTYFALIIQESIK